MRLGRYVLLRSSQPENTYGRFVVEILQTEGLNGFDLVDLDASPMPAFQANDLVVLTRCFLRNVEMDALIEAVNRGAALLCLQPQWTFARRLGWKPKKKVVHDGWVRIRPGYPGSGTPIQTHVPIALYEHDGPGDDVEVIVDAVAGDWTDVGCPAVAHQRMGDGRVALFFYDLPKAVARIRFGDPELASLLTSGRWDFLHAPDLFDGYVDERVNHLPQADFHGQLLAKVLTDLSAYPLVRLWYYPDADHRAAAVFHSDDDLSKPQEFQQLSDAVLRRGGKITFYLMQNTLLDPKAVAELRGKGHTFAPHVNPCKARDEWYFDVPRLIAEETESFQRRFGPCSPSIQCHYAPWQGYMIWVKDFMKSGYRMLVPYASAPPPLLNKYMCGSGRPIKFFDLDGTLYDCRQQPLVTYDDASLKDRMGRDYKVLIEEFARLLNDCLTRHHTAMSLSSHAVSFVDYSKPFFEGCLDLLARDNVPIYNGDQWTQFLDRRQAVNVAQEIASDGRVLCTVSDLTGSVTLMVPCKRSGGAGPTIRVDGRPVKGPVLRRLEEDYCFVPLEGNAERREIHMELNL